VRPSLGKEKLPASFVAATHQCIATTWIIQAEETRVGAGVENPGKALALAEEHLRQAESYCRSLKNKPPLISSLIELVEQARVALDAARAALESKQGDQAAVAYYCLDVFRISPRSSAEREALRLNSRALAHVTARRFHEADDDLTQALDVLKSSKFPNPRLVVMMDFSQAFLRAIFLDKAEQAAQQAKTALDRLYGRTLEELAFLKPTEQRLAASRGNVYVTSYLSIAMKARRPTAEIYQQVFRWKGIVFEEAIKRRRLPKLIEEYSRLSNAVDEAQRVFERCSNSSSANGEQRRETHEKLHQREREFSIFRTNNALKPDKELSALELLSALDTGAVFVDYAMYMDLAGASESNRGNLLDYRYVAFLVRNGATDIFMIPLPASAPVLNRLIVEWRELLPTARPDGERRRRELLWQIAKGIWKPIEPHVKGARLLWICPFDVLWGFPFAAMPQSDGSYLVQQVPIGYAVSGRHALQMLQTRADVGKDGGAGVLVSQIDYEEKAAHVDGGESVAADYEQWMKGRSLIRLSGPKVTKGVLLSAVRRAGMNVCFVGHGMQSQKLKTESSFLHPAIQILRSSGPDAISMDRFEFRIPLAGARLAEAKGDKEPAAGENWVSAEEFAEAAPPSARRFELWMCSSYLGVYLPTEGLQSFPYALLRSGYRTVLASQWNVPQHTALAMIPRRFHAGIFQDEWGDAVALQCAQRDAIDLGGLNALPYHWAAWAVVGDPGRPAPVAAKTPSEAGEIHSVRLVISSVALLGFVGLAILMIARRKRAIAGRAAKSGQVL